MTTLAIFSDVHANIEALTVVVDYIKDQSPDLIVFLGDVVGYGPDPKGCIDLVEDIAHIKVVGNHDYALYKNNFTYFNPLPKLRLLWTKEQLSKDYIELLGTYPLFSISPIFITEGTGMYVHGSPRKPLRDYVSPDLPSWSYNMFFQITNDFADVDFLFLGHTHKPLHITNNNKHLFNPGSVGQPRDRNPKASFMMMEIDEFNKKFSFEIVRLAYDLETTCKKMEELNIHCFLINRLKKGI